MSQVPVSQERSGWRRRRGERMWLVTLSSAKSKCFICYGRTRGRWEVNFLSAARTGRGNYPDVRWVSRCLGHPHYSRMPAPECLARIIRDTCIILEHTIRVWIKCYASFEHCLSIFAHFFFCSLQLLRQPSKPLCMTYTFAMNIRRNLWISYKTCWATDVEAVFTSRWRHTFVYRHSTLAHTSVVAEWNPPSAGNNSLSTGLTPDGNLNYQWSQSWCMLISHRH